VVALSRSGDDMTQKLTDAVTLTTTDENEPSSAVTEETREHVLLLDVDLSAM